MLRSCWSSARPEEGVNRQPQAARCIRFQQAQHAMKNRQVAVRRDYVYTIRLHLHPVFYLSHLHGEIALQELCQQSLVGGVQVLNNDKCHPARGRHMRKKDFQRLKSSR